MTSLDGENGDDVGEERRVLVVGSLAEISREYHAFNNLGESYEGLDIGIREADGRGVRRGSDTGDSKKQTEVFLRVGAGLNHVVEVPVEEGGMRDLVSSNLLEAPASPRGHASRGEVIVAEFGEPLSVERALDVFESLLETRGGRVLVEGKDASKARSTTARTREK